MQIRKAQLSEKKAVLKLLDEFRTDCIEQITGKTSLSNSAQKNGQNAYESLLKRDDYCIYILLDPDNNIVGIITGYLCPMLRSGNHRAEIEEFFVKREYRGNDNAKKLMDAFFNWCKSKNVTKVNLESDHHLHRAHGFYEKYGFESTAQRYVLKLE